MFLGIHVVETIFALYSAFVDMPSKSTVQIMAVELLDDKCADSQYLPSRSMQREMQHGIDIKHSNGL